MWIKKRINKWIKKRIRIQMNIWITMSIHGSGLVFGA